MRNIKSELLSAAEVLALPLMIAVAFPGGAIRFAASREARSTDGSAASVVFLDETSVTRAMRAARTMSRRGGGDRTYINLLDAELPSAGSEPMAAIVPRRIPSALAVVESGVPPFLPSRRAAAPVRISTEPTKDEVTFSRDELLKLN